MNKRLQVKLIGIIIIASSWLLILTGMIRASPLIWLLLLFITIIFYFAITKRPYTRKRDIEKVFEDMDEYFEKKSDEIDFEELEEDDKLN